MSTLKTNNLQLLDASRNISVSKIAEMNGGFSFRNKIVDGRFDFWYEAASQASSGYGSDTMWRNENVGSTKVHSQQPLAAGVDLPSIDVPSAKYFSRTLVTSVVGTGNCTLKRQRIESTAVLAGKTVTISFYAKADSVKSVALELYQDLGSGGSPSASVSIPVGLISLSTQWVRYKANVQLPTLTGKTLGTSNNDSLNLLFWFDAGAHFSARSSGVGQQSGTFDIACVQLEEGSIATPFEELPTEINLARVNRYYQTLGGELCSIASQGYCTAGNITGISVPLAVKMRVVPVTGKFGTWGVNNCAAPSVPVASTTAVLINTTVTNSGFFEFKTLDPTTYVRLDARL